MTARQRGLRLSELGHVEQDHRGLLANARCLTEGVDVPTLDGVAFIDPKRSEVDIVQAVGRAIRLADDKTVGTIVIPVFLGSSDDHEVILDDSTFKTVCYVVRALRMHDEELAEQLDSLRLGLGLGGAEINEHRVRRSLSSRVTGGSALMRNPMVGGLAVHKQIQRVYLRGHRSNDLRSLGNPIPGSCRNPLGGLLR